MYHRTTAFKNIPNKLVLVCNQHKSKSLSKATALSTVPNLLSKFTVQNSKISTKASSPSLPWSSPIFSNNRAFSSLPQLIQQLRKDTGAPMMECKKALTETNNDYEKATEWLRKNGSAKAASKLAGRDATEGMVGIAIQDGMASIVRVASETDFASRSKDFTYLVETVANGALKCESGSIEDLFQVQVANDDKGSENVKTVKDVLDDAILAIRENLQVASVNKIVASSSDSVLAGYVHGKVFQESNAGTSAAIVELKTTSACTLSKDEIQEVGKKLAMHIVAAKPLYRAPEDVPALEIEKEKEILMEQMAGSGKSADILEKIVGGRMRKYYEEVCLMEQGHMLEEGNPKVSKHLAQNGLDLVTFHFTLIQH